MWNEIKTEDDIANFMDFYEDFHDSCIVSLNYSSGMFVNEKNAMVGSSNREHKLTVIFNSFGSKPVELLFEGVRKFSFPAWQDCLLDDIYDAYLAFHTELLGKTRDDRLIVWADKGWFSPAKYVEDHILSRNHEHASYVIAEKLFWRIIDDEEQDSI